MTAIDPAPIVPARPAWMEKWGIPEMDIPGTRVFIFALFIQSIGNGLFYSFVLIYFHKVVGLPLAQVGLALTIASGIGLLANPVAGQIVDKIGARQMVVFAQALQAIGYAGFFFADSIPMVIGVMIITMFGERVYWVAFPTLVATISPPGGRDRWFAFTSAVRNGGLGAGGVLAAGVIWLAGQTGYRILLGADVVGFAVAAAIIFWRVPSMGERIRSATHGGYRQVLADRPAMTVAGANVVFAYCALLVYVALPVFIVETLDMPAWVVGFLFALNTVQLSLGQTLAIRVVSSWRRTRILAAAGGVWIITSGLFALALALPKSILLPYMVVVIMLYTVGELIHAPTSTSLVASLAPDALRGRYLSMVALSWGIAQTIGPGLFTGLLSYNNIAPWIATALIAASGAILVLSAESRIADDILRTGSR